MMLTKPATTLIATTIIACLPQFITLAVAAPPEPKPAAAPSPESRGEMLYAVSCGSCHATEVHWRAKKLATDPERLRLEVLRWKDNTRAAWSDDDVNEVARYLDAAFYRFASADTEKPGHPTADSGARQPQLKPQTQGEISYISGGLQPEERQALRAIARDYNLQLSFTQKRPANYFAGIRITINNAKQEKVLDAIASGPVFLARLPAGRYQLNIEKGAKRLGKAVTIGKGKTVALRF